MKYTRKQKQKWMEKKYNHLKKKKTEPDKTEKLFEGRVATVERTFIIALLKDQPYTCSFGKEIDLNYHGSPVIGDIVEFRKTGEDTGEVVNIKPRYSALIRKREDATRTNSAEEHVIAANIDKAIIVVSLVAPPFHPQLIDRYLLMCEYGGIQPVIAVNKSDLTDERPDMSIYTSMGIPVLFVSTYTGDGMDELRKLLENSYSVVAGHSGVGKSSIVNFFLQEEKLLIGDVSHKAGKGKHTTTVSTLHKISSRSYLIDTPGVRQWGLWNIPRKNIIEFFYEFSDFRTCAFGNCLHLNEQDCGVKDAVEKNLINPQRYKLYMRLMEEAK